MTLTLVILKEMEPTTSQKNPVVLLSLIVANLLTAVLFVTGHGSIMQVLWVYWLQSVIIGAVNVARILSLGPRSQSVVQGIPAGLTSIALAAFFCVHYGFFHLGYLLFLVAFSRPDAVFNFSGTAITPHLSDNIQLSAILLGGAAFAVHHVLSFLVEQKQAKLHPELVPPIMKLFSGPYARILPMHLIIIFGPVVAVIAGTNAVFLLFIGLKTAVDLVLYRRGTSHPRLTTPLVR